jgi:predicted DsbA family dithiol-disulfide isomerase
MQEVLQHPSDRAPRPISGFAILRIPFFLEPDYDETKPYIETNRQRLIRKWGGPAEWEAQKQRHQLQERGQAVGIEHFRLDRWAANTMASHRLIQWISRTFGLYISELTYDRLNQYHFVDGHSLNDVAQLASVVASELETLHAHQPQLFESAEGKVKAPPTTAEIVQFLQGNEGRKEILAAMRLLQHMGIHGIPTFILEGGETILQGAVDAAELVRAFRRIEQRGYLLREEPLFQDVLGIAPTLLERGSYLATDPNAPTSTLNRKTIS